MRRVILAAALVATFASQGLAADARDTIARKYGEAMAISERCPNLVFNSGRASVYLAAAGVIFDDTFKAVAMVSHNRTLTTLYGKSAGDICMVGNMLYGPKGKNGPRLLERK